MKVNQTPDDQLPLMFGTGQRFGARARPTMISAKYRLKEERRKVLKISVAKLKKIEDPESSLRRSVLINNTVRRLQKEARDEKLGRQQMLYGGSGGCILDDADPEPSLATSAIIPTSSSPSSTAAAADNSTNNRNKLLDDDCCDVLSQFYMPPTPRMLTSIDDEDVDDADAVVDVVGSGEPTSTAPKRPRLDSPTTPDTSAAELERRLFSCGGDDLRNSSCCWTSPSTPSVSNPSQSSGSSFRHSSSDDLRLRFADGAKSGPDTEQQQQQYSCGHASIFGEIQSVVFHSLIASLES